MKPTNPSQILKSRGLSAKKSFGQNFLTDPYQLAGIAKDVKSASKSGGVVFEIGTGLGALTQALLDAGLHVHTIERDRDLIPILKEQFASELESGNLTLHEANAATFDFATHNSNKDLHYTVCGNLPYQLTSVFLFRMMEIHDQISGAVFLIQKEVAERIVAETNTKAYGILTVLLGARFDCTITRHIKRGAFWPVPKVDSSIIRLVPKPRSEEPDVNWPLFEKLVKTAFAQRRKTLRNSLSGLENIDQAFQTAGIDPKLRPEDLSVADFVRLTDAFGTMT